MHEIRAYPGALYRSETGETTIVRQVNFLGMAEPRRFGKDGSITFTDHTVLQRSLNKADDLLSEEFKDGHPVQFIHFTSPDFTNHYSPNQYVAVIPTHVDRNTGIIGGRVLIATFDQQEYEKRLEEFRAHYPTVGLYKHRPVRRR